MALTVNTNIFSLTAQAALANNSQPLGLSLQRLSTGLRINSAGDDAAGLAIATRLQSQVNGDNTAVTNANNGVGLLQTAEGALTTITNNLQTIRELAVESANATNSNTDRQSLQAQAAQLIAEIDRVASQTQFNNFNLLDGSFANATFQVGANEGQTITVASIASARTSALKGSAPGFATTLYGNADAVTNATAGTFNAVGYGDLSINNVTIGSTAAGTVNAGETADSAWALANAINAAKGTGVTATANATSTGPLGAANGGSAADAVINAGISAGMIIINGVAIGSVAGVTSGSAAAAGAAVAAEINLYTSQTGVTASANTTTGLITLTNTEGGDILLVTASSGYGLGATGSSATQGTVTLGAQSGSIIIAGTGSANSQFGTGTYYSQESGYVTNAFDASTPPTALAYGGLTVNGVVVNTPAAGGAGQSSDSAWAIANAINSANTGVTAHANATVTGALASAYVFGQVIGSSITINGVYLVDNPGSTFATGSAVDGVQQGQQVANAINNISSQTGVTAVADNNTGRITLTAADGRDITITGGSAVGLGAPSGNAATTYQGSISLSSNASAGIVIGGSSASDAGLTAGTYAANAFSQIIAVSQLDMSTVTGANIAIGTVDAALNLINSNNANLGAYQGRFQSAVVTLQNTSNNLNSAKSNILDADYAVETSNLTKALIVQQADISVLAQANTIPQQILALLPKG